MALVAKGLSNTILDASNPTLIGDLDWAENRRPYQFNDL